MYCAIFTACLALLTWYNPPLLQDSPRQDLEAQRDQAIDRISQLEVEIGELKEEGKVKEASYESQLMSLENTRDQANRDQHAKESTVYKGRIEELERLLEAKDAAQKVIEADAWENINNQHAEIGRLEGEVAWKNAEQSSLQNKLRAKDAELERQRVLHLAELQSQRDKIEALQNALDGQANSMDVDIVPESNALDGQVNSMDFDIVPESNALDGQANSMDIEIVTESNALDGQANSMDVDTIPESNALDAQANLMGVNIIPECDAMEIDVVPDQVCNRLQRTSQADIREERIGNLEALMRGRDLKIDQLQTEARKQAIKMERLLRQTVDWWYKAHEMSGGRSLAHVNWEHKS